MNFDYATVVFSVQKSANETLGDYAKYFVANQDFESLESLVKLSNEVNGYMKLLSSQSNNNVIDAEVVTEVVAEVVNETVQPINKSVAKSSRVIKHSRIATNKYAEIKEFITNYLFERGGQAFYKDLKKAYLQKYKNTFTNVDRAIVSGSPRWSKRFADQVGALRAAGEILPHVKGTNLTCALSAKKYAELAKSKAKSEKQLPLPNLDLQS